MAVTQANIQFRLSGGASNTDVNASLGGVISSTQITTATLANLFGNVGAQEAEDGSVKYRGVYIINTNATTTWQAVVAFINQITPSTSTAFAIGLADEGADTTMATIANEDTAPTGVTFSSPTTVGAGLNLGDIAGTDFYGLWLRRTVTAGATALNIDNMILRARGTTAET